MKINLVKLNIKEAHEHLIRKDFSVLDLVESYLEEIKKRNPEINAYLEIFEKDAKEEAKKIQNDLDNNKDNYLFGIPFAIKDNILINDKKVTASSKILENYKAAYDATVIKKLKEKKVIFLGRTNMDEFAMGSSTENSAYGYTKNPWDIKRVPGGSSGGSAAALAANLCLASLGSDTGGSIRQPAAFCGVVGLKPTYGSVSRFGLIAMTSSLDQIGPFTKNTFDSEIIFKVISGKDYYDSTTVSLEEKQDYLRLYKKEKIERVGILKNFLNIKGIDKKVLENYEKIIKKLEENGFKIEEIEIPLIEKSLAVYYIINPAEVSSNLARFDGIRYGIRVSSDDLWETYCNSRKSGFGKETKRRILLGTYVLSAGYYDAYYYSALKMRYQIEKNVKEAFQKVDIIACPTTPTTAFLIGEKTKDPVSMYLSDIFTALANIAGIPAISIPNGYDENCLPTAIQFMAPHFHEHLLFNIGKEIETYVF